MEVSTKIATSSLMRPALELGSITLLAGSGGGQGGGFLSAVHHKNHK